MIQPNKENSIILFLDLQEEIIKNSKTNNAKKIEAAASALAKLGKLHRLPMFISAVPTGGTFLSSVTSSIEGETPRMRTQTTAFADEGLVAAVKATGRTVLVLSGVASEIVVQRTALDALAAGYTVYVAVDACGGISERTEESAWTRIVSSGGTTTSAVTFAAELAGDFTTELGGQTLAIMYSLLG